MTRFNEAIDQALAATIANFSAEIEGWRNVFLGTLAHDLRGPLTVNSLTAEVLARMTPDSSPAKPLVERLQRSGARMKSLLDDLLYYSKASLGGGIRIIRVQTNLDIELQDELDLLRSLFPEHSISYESGGQTSGQFDASRIREAMANLVINAAKHGDPSGPIQVTLEGDGGAITLVVENVGPVIPDHTMSALFMPFGHFREGPDSNPDVDSLGLGLFIVRQIALAHGGTVAARSVDGLTSFTVELPRVSNCLILASTGGGTKGYGR
ncbi:sensor histidine kinase [Lysobacter sp. GCM10012299]|uniref:sensor histidine kinase n=1 Tax=Lysobacter sp. GCM10012299 TaxID=3317333 RepID=UPI00361A7C70